jgi:hypothetical protein
MLAFHIRKLLRGISTIFMILFYESLHARGWERPVYKTSSKTAAIPLRLLFSFTHYAYSRHAGT